MPKPKFVMPGKWYLVVVCSKCLKDLPFAEARSPEKEPKPKPRSRSVILTCPHCRSTAKYARRVLLTRRQAPESE
jgi:hypothetical protein